MGKFFISLNKLLLRSKALLFVLIILLVGAIGYSFYHLKVNEDFASIFPEDENTEHFNFAIKNSSFADRVIIYFSSTDSTLSTKTDTLIKYADTLVDRIREGFKEQVKEIKYELSNEEMLTVYDFFYNNLPLFLDEEDYKQISEKIEDSSILSSLESNYKTLISPAGIALKQILIKDPLSFTPLAISKLNLFQVGEKFTIENNRIFSKDKNDLFIFITVNNSSKTKEINKFIETIDLYRDEINNKNVGVNYFGSPVISAANANRIKGDIKITVSITILFFFILLSLYFRNSLIPFLLFVPVIVGGGISLMVLYLIKGEVSAISLGIGSVLLGIGIDYSLHFITHYKHSLSLQNLFKDISVPVIISSITTASAFLCLLVIKSPGLQDLGLFAAISVLSAALATLVILPLILIPVFKPKIKKVVFSLPDAIADYRFDKNKVLLISVIVLSVLFYYTGKRTSFNENLMDMNYMTEELKVAEKKINQSTQAMSNVFVVSSGENLEEALTNNALVSDSLSKLKRDGTIEELNDISKLVLAQQQQEEKIRIWNSFWVDNNDRLFSSLSEYGKEIGFRPETFRNFKNLLNKDFEPISFETIDQVLGTYFQDYVIEKEGKSAVVTMIKTDRSEKKQIDLLIDNFENSHFLDRQAFTENLFSLIKAQFKVLIWLSMIIVFIILLLSFGRIELAIISFVPIILSWVWTIGIMGIFNLQFNVFNIIISTFIFGLGVDYSIFITKGLLQKLQFNRDNFKSFKTSVLLSGFTTISATGVLVFAGHPALKSIALVSVIGITSTIFVSFTVQPLLFNFLTYNKGNKRTMPITLYNFFFAFTSLLYFLFSALTAILLVFVFRFISIKTDTKKIILHSFVRFFSNTVVYWNVHVKKILTNFRSEIFDKPTLAISNHQSTLDLMATLFMHPKIVIYANDKSLNNKFYGPVIRFLDFIPSSEGLEKTAVRIKERMSEGYSVIIFPEGTRSADCKIKRFHKGAFYLANQLDLEIQPILLHGFGLIMNKKEFFLRRGRVVIKMLDKINLKGDRFGTDYSSQTKGVLKYMRGEYDKIRLEMEVPDRMKYFLINRYIFRGPIIEWYLRVKLMLEKNYNLMHKIVPMKGTVTDIGCGYGFMASMLALTSDERIIRGIDYDEDKIITAQNCTLDLYNLTFEHGDVMDINLPESDVFLLADVLHYMSAEKQTNLIFRCFAKLNSGGMIIIRDADTDLKRRTVGTRISEFLSTGIGFNKADEKLTFVSKQLVLDVIEKNEGKVKIIDKTKFNSNIIYIISR